ncbi:hypothetical protein HY498_05060 [Candidatus Woesearchaeota archaeon]|nr:hypothetical protein [Candidatus Woesearchaeota archaeon]
MKARFKNSGKEEVCQEYPNCNCKGHLVYVKSSKPQASAQVFCSKCGSEIVKGRCSQSKCFLENEPQSPNSRKTQSAFDDRECQICGKPLTAHSFFYDKHEFIPKAD